jgi:tetratricopeptide (TPR) repeat protein
MRFSPILSLLLCVACAAVLAGCSSGEKKPTDRDLAQKRWAAARSSVQVSLAKDQFRNGQFDQARQTTDEALRLTPENAQAHLMSARLHIEKGQLEAAEHSLATVRQLTPNDGEAYYLSGVIQQRWQKNENAYLMYQEAAQRSPAELAYMLAVAESLVTLDRSDEALALLQSRADYFEHSGTIRDAIGQLLMQKKNYKDAARAFRQASILSEDEPAIKERLAMALYQAKEYRETIEVVTRLVQLDAFARRGDLFVTLGECQLQLGQARDARLSFETASQVDPYSPAVWRGIGRAALESGDLKRAELALAKSAKLDATQSQTHLLTGYLMTRLDRFDEALAAFQVAVSLDPADTTSLCMIGYVYEKKGRPDIASRYYGKALQLRPGDEMARRMMAAIERE